jgi:hypothetical protein
MPPAPSASASATPDLVLVGCVKKKLAVAAPARELYTSPLFRKGRVYAERAGAPWFVLSAEHGLVDPDEIVEPYDLRLSKTSREYRRTWGARVLGQLRGAVGSVNGKVIELHAGSAYTDAVRGLLEADGASVVEPLAGLTMGARLAWYGRTNQVDVAPASPPTAHGDAAKLVARLARADEAITPEQFLASGGDGMRSPGLYSWWIDSRGATTLSRGLGLRVDPGLIYAGLAGATRSRSGRKSKNTLWGRITTMHLGGRHEFSTFRLSLGSVLAEFRGEDEIDEEALTTWMHAHLRVVAVPVADADALNDVETEVLTELDPPLNLAKVQRSPLRGRLSAMRKKHGQKRRPSKQSSAD